MLTGYKTYATALIAVLYALYSHFAGSADPGAIIPMMDWPTVIKTVLAAMAVAGLRSGLNTGILSILAGMGVSMVGTPTPLKVKVARISSGVARAAPMLVLGAILIFSPILQACATPFGTVTPQETLNVVATGFALAEATYDGICTVNSPPAFCAENAASYAKAKLAVQAALQTAQAAINVAGGADSGAIEQLLATLSQDWNTFNNIVNTVKAKNAVYVKTHH